MMKLPTGFEIRSVVLVLAVLLTLVGCSDPAAAPRAEVDKVRVVVLPFLSMAPFQIAAEDGYFTEQHLDVELIRLTNVKDFVPMLVQGEIDAAVGMVTVGILNAIDNGARIRTVAAMSELVPGRCPFIAFITRRDLLEAGALDDAERVRGMRFDTELLMAQAYWTEELLRPLSLTIDDVELIDLPEANAAKLLLDGATDVASLAEPMLGLGLASEELAIWRPASEIDPGHPMSVILYGPTLLDERPHVGERFAAAMLGAIRQFRKGKTPRNLELVHGFTGLPTEVLASACWPDGDPSARIKASAVRGFQEWAVRRGLIERVLSDDEWIDSRFIEFANAQP